MASLTLIHNAFDTNDKTVLDLVSNDLYTPLYNVIPKYIKEFENKSYDVLFSINGVITDNLNYMLKKGDHLAIVPIPAGGGGGAKDVLRIVALVALVIVAPYAAAAAIGATGVAVGAAGFYAVQAGIMIAGGLLINSLLPVQVPSTTASSNLETSSPTYSFSGGSNAVAEGTSIPIVLGKASITPPIISSYISLSGDSQYLNILYALNDGKFDSIESITVNDQDVSNYEDIYYYRRLGTNNQAVISNFSDNIVTNSDGRALNDTSTEVIYSTDSNAVNEIQLGFLMPKGLFYIKDDGSYVNRTIDINIFYREVGSSTWLDAPNYISVAAVNDTGAFGKMLSGLVEKGAFSEDPNTSSIVRVTDTFKTAKRIVFTIPGLDEGEYEVKIQRTSAYDTNTRVANDLQLEYVNEITYDDLTYPNTGLLSLNALATDQLSGGYPTVKILMNNTYVRYWEDDVLVEDTNKRLDNPAWAAYYILRKAGFTDDTIDVTAFQDWADYCVTKSYTCNLVLDSRMELPDILNLISPLGRAKIIQKGTKWGVVVDRIVSAPTQSFLFTSGNIIDKSFSLDYLPYTDRANVVEVTYYDEDNDYQAMTVQAQSINHDASVDEYKTSITYYGCTNKQMAANYAQFLVNNNRYITETVSFTASIDSLACNVGDVIKVGTQYLTNNEADGRIVSDTSGTLILDNSVNFEAGKSYSIDIRKSSDDTLHTFEIVNPEIETNGITLINPTTTFDKFDVYSVGQTGYQANLYRVLDISRSNDFERKISAVEYIPEVYDDTLTIPDEQVLVPSNSVTNLKATSVTIKETNGSITDIISISWQGGDINQPILINQKEVGSSISNSFDYDKALDGNTYFIKVGDKALEFQYVRQDIIVSNVADISSTSSNGNLTVTWSLAKDVDFSHYEIQLKGQIYKTLANSIVFENLGIGSYDLTLYSVSKSNVRSEASYHTGIVTDRSLYQRILDSSNLKKAFDDGLMTVYLGAEPLTSTDYDIWFVKLEDLTLGEYTYASAELDNLSWVDFDTTITYKYYYDGNWYLCDASQIQLVQEMFKFVNYAAIADGNVRIFSKQPAESQRYDIGDLWIKADGTLMECTAKNY